MNALQIIEPEKLHGDVFTMIGKEWMLVTACLLYTSDAADE